MLQSLVNLLLISQRANIQAADTPPSNLPRLVSFQAGSGVWAQGVLIDSTGKFLVSSSFAPPSSVQATLREGGNITLRTVFSDPITQIAVLQANPWNVNQAGSPLSVATPQEVIGQRVKIIAQDGVSWGEYVSDQRYGLIKPANRYMPLGEIRMESLPKRIGGALVFTESGKFAGILGATLESIQTTEHNNLAKTAPAQKRLNSTQFGPQGLLVTYSVGLEVLDRVVEGFRRKSPSVSHPSIGISFRNSKGGGAVIASISPDSTGANAQLSIGEVILKVDSTSIHDALELASLLFRKKVGSEIVLTIRTIDGREVTRKVKVGSL